MAPGTGSPAISGNQVFVINRANVLTSASIKTGDINWRLRIKGPISSLIKQASHLLFIFSEEGLCQIIDIKEDSEAEVLKEIDLKKPFFALLLRIKDVFVRSDKTFGNSVKE